ncbi:MAG: cytochrome c oxidase assembly protein [Actinomycetota bacterium]|nr:cytochrome c oxidase assembly protein [Actinomycetota bacterium]
MTLAHAPLVDRAWSGAWDFDPLLGIAVVLTAFLFARGTRKIGSRSASSAPEVVRSVAFYAGLAIILVAVSSPGHALAETLLSAHMVQHVMLIVMAAPLIAYARPGLPIMLALPTSIQKRLRADGVLRLSRVIRRGVANPPMVWVLGAVALWVWHLPGPYDWALRSEVGHRLEHLSFLGTALLFWAVVVPRRSRYMRHAAAIALTFATGLQSAALGAVLAFATQPLYPTHARRAVDWGLAPLTDQQLAGVIMWVPMSGLYVAIMATLFLRWMREMDRRLPPQEVATADTRERP